MQKQTEQMLGASASSAGPAGRGAWRYECQLRQSGMTPETPGTPSIPKVGFVSLGCPKALTDSELILTQLSAEGYQTSKTFEGADLVIVNTCGFIDDAVRESLDTIGEALAENGRSSSPAAWAPSAGEGRRQPGAQRCTPACWPSPARTPRRR
jgi:hypothetical protein